jgi:hypothetical protein
LIFPAPVEFKARSAVPLCMYGIEPCAQPASIEIAAAAHVARRPKRNAVIGSPFPYS